MKLSLTVLICLSSVIGFSQCNNYSHFLLDGNANDAGINNFDGTIINGVSATQDRFGATNSAMNFNGTNQYIDLPTDFDFTPRSINIWFQAESSSTTQSVIYDSDHPGLSNSSTKMYVWVYNSQTSLITSMGNSGLAFHAEPINLNQWYMGTIVIGTDVKFYLNAQLTATFALNSGSATAGHSTSLIGADRLISRFFDGDIDDVNIYNCAINQQTIDSLYNYSPSSNCVMGDYNFSGNINDVSGNGFTGTNHGASLTNNRFNNSNSAYNFDGVGDYIDLPTDFDYPVRSINAWFRAESSSTTQAVIYDSDHPGLTNSSTKLYVWDFNGERSIIMSMGNSGLAFHNEPINLNQWYMGTIVIDSDVKFYLNAQLIATFALNSGNSTAGHSTALIGADRTIARFFDGDIDDVLIYNCAIDQSTIDSLYGNFTSVNQNSETENSLTVFPNPVNDVLTIGLPKYFHSISVTVYDATGRQISSPRLNGNELNVADFDKGIYILNMVIDGKNYIQKFIKN